ncbi:SDR family oxidoreductase [Nocardia zapadnayensis]|uniref:SDR family NAD(P)-dependent oxidoreductase n=1 Tax=Nocardia rhamnosiphila TaxID=426716 RepID=UPI002247D643|nr:SDR family oxidoreductase [Nocardia zapadnayensis]MCX0274611.1 SDR family oxidoreductase [Nocardia zapadnayensis]
MGNELAGKVAVVTGGATGLGSAMVERFVAEGARVVVGDLDAERGAAVARRCGAGALFRTADVGDPEQIAALVECAVERFGGLDIMCNNAGISGTMHRSILHDDFADFHRVMSVNVLGVMAGTRLAARYMSEHGGGSIINLSSVGGVQAGGGVMTYRASKAAVIHFTKSAAIELAQYDIRVNCLAPGNIPTDLLAKASTTMSPEKAERMTRAMREMMNQDRPLPREGTPEDVAEAAVYFAGDRSRYLTGTVLTVDGGTTAGKPLRARRPDPAANGSASAPAGSS